MTKQVHRQKTRLKPIGLEGIEKCRDIINNGFAKVNEVMVDGYSASALVQVYDKLDEKNQAKLITFPVGKVMDIVWKLIKTK